MAAGPESASRDALIKHVTRLVDDHADLTALLRQLLLRARFDDQCALHLHVEAEELDTLRRLTGSP